MTALGVCQVIERRSWKDQIAPEKRAPAQSAFNLLADIFGRAPILRLVVSAPDLFPTPTTIEQRVVEAVDENIRRAQTAGYRVALNLVNCPPWASGGKAAYVSEVNGSSCAVIWRRLRAAVGDEEARRRIDVLYLSMPHVNLDDDAIALQAIISVVGDPEAPPDGGPQARRFDPTYMSEQFLLHYRAELTASLAYDDPFSGDPFRGTHVWGQRPDVDKYSAPRPFLFDYANFPRVDHDAMEYMGRIIGELWPGCVLYLLGNEWDIAPYYPCIAGDVVNREGGPDTFLWVLNDWYKQFWRGLLDAIMRASFGERVPVLSGPTVAYPGSLDRFLALPDQILGPVLDFHAYGPGGGGVAGSYEHLAIYKRLLAKRPALAWISEVDFDNITEWYKHVAGMNLGLSGIVFNVGDRFVNDWRSGEKTEDDVTEEGRKMREFVRSINGRKHAVRA